MKTKDLTTMAILTALAMALSWVERMIPLEMLIPLPGVKLGLANTVTLFALYRLNLPAALLILTARCLLAALFRPEACWRCWLWPPRKKAGISASGESAFSEQPDITAARS